MIYEFKPKQDLHGYDKPWPAGGNVNLYDYPLNTNVSHGQFVSYVDGVITLKATAADLFFGNIKATEGAAWTEDVGFLVDVSALDAVTVSLSNTNFTKNFYNKYDSDKKTIGTYTEVSSNVFTIDTSDCDYVGFRFGYGSSVSGTVYQTTVQVEAGSTATDWTPYSNICPISGYDITGFDDPVYAGMLDSSSGILTVAQVSVDLGSLTWYYSNAEDHERMYVSSLASIVKKPPNNNTAANIMCSEYENATSNDTYLHNDNNIIGVGDNGWIFIYSTEMGTDPAAFKTKMTGVQLVYTLLTPEEFQLTQEQINELIAQMGEARNFGSRTNMLNTWMKLAQGFPVSEEELHMLRPSMRLPDDVVLRPTFEDTPLPVPDPVPDVLDTPAAEPEENITESEES